MKIKLILFATLALIQLAVPATMIVHHERLLRTGLRFRFLCAPFDPYDAFRGRYVALRFDQNHGPFAGGGITRAPEYGTTVYALLEVDAKGFARVRSVTAERPRDGSPYCQAKAQFSPAGQAYLEWPFERYYMEEAKAPQAEQAYRTSMPRKPAKDQTPQTWASVRIKDGRAVLEELYIGDQPIREYLRTHPQ
jgi:uncharacterized membrane-anchored protein